MKVICDYCGKELERKRSQVKKAKKHFCSKDHFYKYRNKYNYQPVNEDRSYGKLIKLANLRRERMIRNEN